MRENKMMPFYVITTIVAIGIIFLGWQYIIAIRGKNSIELQKIELEKEKIETEKESTTSASFQTYSLQFRNECEEEKEETVQDAEDYINSCTRSNDINFCITSQAYTTIYMPKLQEISETDWLEKCIQEKLNEIGF